MYVLGGLVATDSVLLLLPCLALACHPHGSPAVAVTALPALALEWAHQSPARRKQHARAGTATPGYVLGVVLVPLCMHALALTAEGAAPDSMQAQLLQVYSRVALCLALQSLLWELGHRPAAVAVGLASVVVLPWAGSGLGGTTVLGASVWLWVLQHVLGGVLGGCFTSGEGMVLAQLLALAAGDALVATAGRLGVWLGGIGQAGSWALWLRPPGYCCSLAAILGVLAAGVVLQPLLLALSYKGPHHKALSHCFTLCLLLLAGGLLLPWAWGVGGMQPVVWLVAYVAADSTRPLLLAYWGLAVGAAVAAAALDLGGLSKVRQTVRRKYYHVLAVLLFGPAIALDLQFMALAFAGALALFVAAEYYCAMDVAPLGLALRGFMAQYVDHRDTGPIVMAHSYLLLGCALPVWLHVLLPRLEQATACQRVAPYAGLVALGIGDTFASVVGSRYGRRRWHSATSKTIEGTLAAAGSQLALGLLLLATTSTGPVHWHTLLREGGMLGIAVLHGSMVEACTDHNDNLVLPMTTQAMCLLLARWDPRP